MRFFHINKIKLLFFLFERTDSEIKSGTRVINTKYLNATIYNG